MTTAGVEHGQSVVAPRVRTLTVANGYYAACLVLTTVGFYAYWGLWVYKFFYLSWLLCLIVALGLSSFGRLSIVDPIRNAVPVLGWVAFLGVSALWAPDPRTTAQYAFFDLICPIAFIIGFLWVRTLSRNALALFFELQFAQIVPLMIWYTITAGGLTDEFHGAARSDFAARTLMGIPFLVWRLRSEPGVLRGVLLLMALIAIVALQSRALMLIAPLVMLGSWVFVQPSGRRTVAALQLLSVCFAAGILGMAIPAVRESVLGSFERFGPKETNFDVASTLQSLAGPAQERADIERRVQLFVAAESFVNHPLTGAGFFSTYALTGTLLAVPVAAHGLPSTLLGETGLIGTAFFISIVAVFFRRIRRATATEPDERERGFLRICLVAMVGALLLGLFQQVDQAYWFYVLLAWGYGVRPSPSALAPSRARATPEEPAPQRSR